MTTPLHPTAAELELLIRARYPLVWLVTHEERRAERLLRDVAARLSREVVFWSVSEGFDHKAYADGGSDLATALDRIRSASEKRIFVLRDVHTLLRDAGNVRRLRDAIKDLRTSYKSLLILDPVLEIPAELSKDTTVVDLPLPKAAELGAILDGMLASVPAGRITVTREPELIERVIKATLGLTETEAENVFAKAIVHGSSFGPEDLPLIIAEKKQILRKTGLLEYYDLSEDLSSVGGLGKLKLWLAERSSSFSEKARRYGIPAPKGILLLGVQGCGKSLTAKAVASEWKMPLLRLDLGRIFNSFIGASEANMRAALGIAESLAPCVLWVDEIEKGLSGLKSSGSVDSGVTARVFSSLLTWMQEKTAPVFIVATANRVADLPPELLRKGRFDEIFFIDLPDDHERADIWRIHLARRKRDPALFEIDALVRATAGWSGAEIEQALVAALHATFPQDRDVQTADLLHAVSESIPLSQTMSEEIESLRSWARGRTRAAR